MSAAEALHELGGTATRQQLLAVISRRQLAAAVSDGQIQRVARGRYACPEVAAALQAAHALGGVLSHESAALHLGWATKSVPAVPHVTVARHRRVSTVQAVVHYANLEPHEVSQASTSPQRTLLDCARTLPYDAALCVADSALRAGVPPNTLRRVAVLAQGPASPSIRRVMAAANGDADNPFESTLRAISHKVDGLKLIPQLRVMAMGVEMRPDLVDRDLRIIVEADSFAWHGDRAALARDARRYNRLVAAGWIVLRFTWEEVMFDPGYVFDVLVSTVERAQRLA
ncbi:MAG TPA: type IV toxin-antitoxin system AbiEi family antitoxin domain-containing protein [Marmoricola sp.]|nr:type IV toxin-antitoxin system AbiEi family antitoxin domain-containing protein [Marmoricola sp.]